MGIIPNHTYREYLSLRPNAYKAFRTRLTISKILSVHSFNFSADYGQATHTGRHQRFISARLGLNYRVEGFL